jgi:hypothetical protein
MELAGRALSSQVAGAIDQSDPRRRAAAPRAL